MRQRRLKNLPPAVLSHGPIRRPRSNLPRWISKNRNRLWTVASCDSSDQVHLDTSRHIKVNTHPVLTLTLQKTSKKVTFLDRTENTDFFCGPFQPAWMWFLQARERVMHAMGQMGLMPKEAPKDVKVRRMNHLSITSYELSPSQTFWYSTASRKNLKELTFFFCWRDDFQVLLQMWYLFTISI